MIRNFISFLEVLLVEDINIHVLKLLLIGNIFCICVKFMIELS